MSALACALATVGIGSLPAPIDYRRLASGGHGYHVVTADVRSPRLSLATSHSKHLQSVWRLLSNRGAVAAVTGTFFAPRSQTPVADVVVDGTVVAKGARGSVIAADWYGNVHIFDSGYAQAVDWFEYRYALRGAVRLVRDGRVAPDPKAQHFRDSRIWGRAPRVAAGTTRTGKLVLVATSQNVTLSELGRAMVAAGAVNAVNLDGGGSTAMYYKGRLVVAPKRKLSNLLLICQS